MNRFWKGIKSICWAVISKKRKLFSSFAMFWLTMGCIKNWSFSGALFSKIWTLLTDSTCTKGIYRIVVFSASSCSVFSCKISWEKKKKNKIKTLKERSSTCISKIMTALKDNNCRFFLEGNSFFWRKSSRSTISFPKSSKIIKKTQ